MGALGLSILPLTAEEAETAERLQLETCSCDLSHGDRACLSLGLSMRSCRGPADWGWIPAASTIPQRPMSQGKRSAGEEPAIAA